MSSTARRGKGRPQGPTPGPGRSCRPLRRRTAVPPSDGPRPPLRESGPRGSAHPEPGPVAGARQLLDAVRVGPEGDGAVAPDRQLRLDLEAELLGADGGDEPSVLARLPRP